MPRSHFPTALLGAALGLACLSVQAAEFQFSGDLYNNTDRVSISFEVIGNGTVSLWTDSWNSGQNFDPISVLWRQSSDDYVLIQEVDDNDGVALGQGFYDTGMTFGSALAAGHYLYVVGASFAEPFAKGNLLSQGYAQDGIIPTPIALWNQPSYDINANDQKGTSYSIRLSGVETATITTAVPEPTSTAMMLVGLLVMGGIARRRSLPNANHEYPV